jgi:hypothetical protein
MRGGGAPHWTCRRIARCAGGELLRSMMMGQRGWVVKMRTLDATWIGPEKCTYAKHRSGKCPQVTTQSALPGLPGYANAPLHNAPIDSSRDDTLSNLQEIDPSPIPISYTTRSIARL